jgi:adenosylmethionine-8-amino-7-oxononanoate aminotransferase
MSVHHGSNIVQSKHSQLLAVGELPFDQFYAIYDWVWADRVFFISRDGQCFQDCFSGGGYTSLGYTPELAVLDVSHEPHHVQVSKRCNILSEIAPPGLSHVFLRRSADAALKAELVLARNYFVAVGQPQKSYFLELEVTSRTIMRTMGAAKTMQEVDFDIRLLFIPVIHSCSKTKILSEHEHPADWISQAIISEKIFIALNDADRCAAIIVQPVQFVGELESIPSGFLARLFSEYHRLNILLIVNEKLSSFGRAGGVFFCSDEAVIPDVLVVGDGMRSGYERTGAVLLADQIGAALIQSNSAENRFNENSHPDLSDLSVLTAALEHYAVGGALEAALDIVEHFRRRLNELTAMPYVGEVRVKGLLATITIVQDKVRKVCFAHHENIGQKILLNALEHGVVFKVIEDDVLAFAPSFNYTFADIDALVEACLECYCCHVFFTIVRAGNVAHEQ